MARQQRFTVEQVVAALEKCQGLVYLAARELQCHPNTILNYRKRYRAVADAIVGKFQEQLDAAELALYAAVRGGQAWAICFLLKTQGKSRGYIERSEIDLRGIDAFIERELARLASGGEAGPLEPSPGSPEARAG